MSTHGVGRDWRVTGLLWILRGWNEHPFDVVESQRRLDVWMEIFTDKKRANGFCRCECLSIQDGIGYHLSYGFQTGDACYLNDVDAPGCVSDGVNSAHAQVKCHCSDVVGHVERSGSPSADSDIVLEAVETVGVLGEKAHPDGDVFWQQVRVVAVKECHAVHRKVSSRSRCRPE